MIIKKENKNEELQSRREFFKNAAKKALPVLGAAVLTSLPFVSQEAKAWGCQGSSCYAACANSCSSYCSSGCSGSCSSGCKQTCANRCNATSGGYW